MKTSNFIFNPLSDLKLRKTQFRFSNKKSLNSFFDNALIESPIKFIRLYEERFREIIQITASWYIVMKIIAYTLLGITPIMLFSQIPIIGITITVLSLLFYLASNYLGKKAEKYVYSLNTFKSLAEVDNYALLEFVRGELIESKNKSK